MKGTLFSAKTTLEMTWEEVKEASVGKAIVFLVVGSVEQHGAHLPIGVDTLIPLEICRRAQDNLSRTAAGYTFSPWTMIISSVLPKTRIPKPVRSHSQFNCVTST